MNYWLMKSEPDTYSLEDLKNEPDQIEHWDGVRNYQARNMLRDQMKTGDLAFFYHSNTKVPGIVGVVEIVKAGYPDHTAFDPESKYFDPKSNPESPRWFMVDVKFKHAFKEVVSLESLKANPALTDMLVVRKGNRLSITPVEKRHWDIILKMAE